MFNYLLFAQNPSKTYAPFLVVMVRKDEVLQYYFSSRDSNLKHLFFDAVALYGKNMHYSAVLARLEECQVLITGYDVFS